MKVYHGSDLWTWYKLASRGKPEPASIQAKLGPNGLIARPTISGQDDSTDAPSTSARLPPTSASAPPPTSTSTSTRQPEAPPAATNDTEASPPPRAEQDTAATRPTLTASPARTSLPAPEEPDALRSLVSGENPPLASLIAYASQKAAEQLVAAFKPQMDELLRRIDRLNADSDSPLAEDRPQDPRTEQ
ncbi:hypothetical protein AAVH_23937 [Aphelenchoides avenae]|nr:hypothetical protein AAVH_23937 [Aphelenchus avenae]